MLCVWPVMHADPTTLHIFHFFLLYYILVCNDLIRYAIMCSWWVGVFINIFLFLFCSLGRNARYVLDAHIYVYIHTRVCVCVCIHTHEYVYAHVPILHKTGKNMWMREWSHQAYVCHAVWSTAFFFSFVFLHTSEPLLCNTVRILPLKEQSLTPLLFFLDSWVPFLITLCTVYSLFFSFG